MASGCLTSFLLLLFVVYSYNQDLGHDYDTLAGDPSFVRVRRQVDIDLGMTLGQDHGQVMELQLKCPDNDMSEARLILLHDGEAIAKARCLNGNFTFQRLDIARLQLRMTLNRSEAGVCQMWRSSRVGKTYSLIAAYAPGNNVSAMFLDENEENAICNFDDTGSSFGNITRISRPFARPRDKPIYKGGAIQQKIVMEVVDILGKPLRDKAISMSRLIRLKATIYSLKQSIYALTCVAMNDAGAKYKLIKGSCGDGLVFKHNDGFTSNGNVTFSPYFKVFRLAGSFNLRFKCLFASCPIIHCDKMNSCPYARPRRTTPAVVLPPKP